MLDKAVDQLKETLQQEQLMYLEVLNLANRKTDVISKGRIKELDEITKTEQRYMMKMGTFEKIRRSVFVNVAEALEVEEIGSLSEFLLHLSNEQDVNEIDRARHQLLEVVDRIKTTNEVNQKLMEEHLEYIEFSLNLMTDHLLENNSLQYGGNQPKGQKKIKKNLFDARV